ncbi:Periplasmic trehalase precursor [Sodalis glossinidius str. 'morsitans']|uniref:Periplasmic trehalase n=1 Tax=Sodalis glossinidius (strain morsitans) TaxID=343509 RepID=Q2NRR4_SODGM|nr:alpha,alpha-trehalase TreA [Sodalis glossinidius]BAE75161.1 periplasmic trehalase [Sodalis glossinidius str. 'morsitans']CRL46119.1 Periplasmic trehalase precursor [Sodalis glossinidius str. 'morsitans']
MITRSFRWTWKSFITLGAVLSTASGLVKPLPPVKRTPQDETLQSPDIMLGQLYIDVQTAKLYPDQKTFADAVPRRAPSAIIADYQNKRLRKNFNLRHFVDKNFIFPTDRVKYVTPTGQSLREHIITLWPVLTRNDARVRPHDSLLQMPHDYVVPGGRFREIYYWDSYFTMLGLAESGKWDLVRGMTENFAHEINVFGRIPNGNRSYYISRSQPPFFSLMVDLVASQDGAEVYQRYLPQLKKEYDYWMEGYETLDPGVAAGRLARMHDGAFLNRYWDDEDTPRTESYLDDILTASEAKDRPVAEVYRDLRAGAASGWDFSSRWFDNPLELSSIRTTSILPVDLNALMYHLEHTLANASHMAGDNEAAGRYSLAAQSRKAAINQHLWNEAEGYYADYDWLLGRLRDQLTAATVFPLYNKIAPPDYARCTAVVIRQQLLKQGGMITTTNVSGQQWDAPNGWAPLQWVAVEGLRHYGEEALAEQIATRFLGNVQRLYNNQHKLVEKYVVEGSGLGGGGGEYPLQDGFGWTNGVTLKLMVMYCGKSQDNVENVEALLAEADTSQRALVTS